MVHIKDSLVFKIGIAYVFLTILNLIFFSVIIIENQTDLLITNFKYQADSLAKSTLSSLRNLEIGKRKNKSISVGTDLRQSLSSYDLNWYKLFDRSGLLLQEYSSSDIKDKSKKKSIVSKEVIQKVQQLLSNASLFQARYMVELKKEDFSIEVLLPVGVKKKTFLFASLNLKSMRDRLNRVYYQVAGAVVWGILFHFLFAIFLMRLIFRRVSFLVNASTKMGGGDLSSRVEWKMNDEKRDELDVLGLSFNTMAGNVQEKVQTISHQIEVISGLNKQIQQELKVGKEVQRLLISAPESIVEDLRPQVYYRPLREVSGDMFHYFKLSDGARGVFFADASGHGVPAALVTAISFLSLEDVLRRSNKMEGLMNALNNSITNRMQQAFYLTAALMIFNDSGQLWVTNAGHNTFFILPKGKEKISIESDGLPIGILPDAEYPMHSYSVNKGDKVFIYSDGLVETTNDKKEEFGMDRLLSIMDKHNSSSVEELSKEVQSSFDNFACNFIDDVTFLALEVS